MIRGQGDTPPPFLEQLLVRENHIAIFQNAPPPDGAVGSSQDHARLAQLAGQLIFLVQFVRHNRYLSTICRAGTGDLMTA